MKAKLYDYQEVGFKWLACLHAQGVGGILGDSMGLGKTLQAIALMSHVAQAGTTKPFMVISPLSVASNWCVSFHHVMGALVLLHFHTPVVNRWTRRCDELQKFAPSLKVVLYTGDKQQREAVQQDNGASPGSKKVCMPVCMHVNMHVCMCLRLRLHLCLCAYLAELSMCRHLSRSAVRRPPCWSQRFKCWSQHTSCA